MNENSIIVNLKNGISRFMRDSEDIYEVIDISFFGFNSRLTIRNLRTGKEKKEINPIELVPLESHLGFTYDVPEKGIENFDIYQLESDGLHHLHTLAEILYVELISKNSLIIVSEKGLYHVIYVEN